MRSMPLDDGCLGGCLWELPGLIFDALTWQRGWWAAVLSTLVVIALIITLVLIFRG